MEILRQFLLEAGGWNYDEFTRVWNESPDRDTVAKHFGITPAHASAIAQQLRYKGFELKKHPRGRKLGKTLEKKPSQGKELPARKELVRMWNEKPSFTSFGERLGLSPSVARQLLIKLKDEGEDIRPVGPRGRPKKIDLDEKVFVRIWEASSTIAEVIEKVREMGIEGDTEFLRQYLTQRATNTNRLRRASGIPDLKKLERPTYHKSLKFAEEKPSELSFDDPDDSLKDFLDDTSLDGEPDDTEDLPQQFDDEVTQPGEPEFEEPADDIESMQADSEREFAEAWNSSDSFKDMMRTLKQLGWELSKDDIKAKASELRQKGIQLKKFV